MKSVSRDDILSGNLVGLFLVYSHSGSTTPNNIENELKVRFQKLGYPFDLMHEGYDERMKIKGLLYRDNTGVCYVKADKAPFLRSDVSDTEAGWTQYFFDKISSGKGIEIITNFTEQGVWGPMDWRMVPFTGIGRAVAERGIINWGLKKLPISSWDGKK
jgi:hypothetical protein